VDEDRLMDGPDEIIHQSTRLKLMAALRGIPANEMIEFTRLKAILKATDGNLGTHLGALEKAGYIEVAKDFVAKKPRTRVAMTRAGRTAFENHVAYQKDIIEG
jgi:DNA-binding MarR family transcriptional regulator